MKCATLSGGFIYGGDYLRNSSTLVLVFRLVWLLSHCFGEEYESSSEL